MPVTVKPLPTERLPLTLRTGVARDWNVPVVALIFVPVIVVPLNAEKTPDYFL